MSDARMININAAILRATADGLDANNLHDTAKVARDGADEIERLEADLTEARALYRAAFKKIDSFEAALRKIAMWGCINPEDHAATSEVAYAVLDTDK